MRAFWCLLVACAALPAATAHVVCASRPRLLAGGITARASTTLLAETPSNEPEQDAEVPTAEPAAEEAAPATEINSAYSFLGEVADKAVDSSVGGIGKVAKSDFISTYGVITVQAVAAAAAFYFIVSNLFDAEWWSEPLVKVEGGEITGLNL